MTIPVNLTDLNVGDYITRDDWILLQIAAIMPSSSEDTTLLGLAGHKNNELQWHTLYELIDMGAYKAEAPDYKAWEKLETGDLIHCGLIGDNNYATVLVRVGDAVMISLSPMNRKKRDQFDAIASQLEDLTEGDVTKAEVQQTIGMPKTNRAAHKTANKWYTIQQLACQHWRLLKEEM